MNNIVPMKYLHTSDVEQLGNQSKITLSSMKKVMTMIDKRAIEKGLSVQDRMTHIEINSLFFMGQVRFVRQSIERHPLPERGILTD